MKAIGNIADTIQAENIETANANKGKIALSGFADYYRGIPDDDTTRIDNSNLDVPSLVNTYLLGLDLTDPEGVPFPKSLIASYINSAIAWAEGVFDIDLSSKSYTDEMHDYERGDYMNWGYIRLWHRPIVDVTKLTLMYGNRPSMEIPKDWLKIDRKGGIIQLFPSSGSANTLIITGSGAIWGLQGAWNYAPQMWSIDYTSGIPAGEMPPQLKELIYKKASIGVLQVWGDLILGAGIANQSISVDGLSQSIGTTQSAMFGGASARIDDYRKDIDSLIPVIRQQYSGIKMTVV